MTATGTTVLNRSDAILRVLQILQADEQPPVERLLLEGIAYMAHQPAYSDNKCRVLRAFGGNQWLLDFHQSLAYLQQMGRVQKRAGEYRMTQLGEQHLATLDQPAKSTIENESKQIDKLATSVRKALGL